VNRAFFIVTISALFGACGASSALPTAPSRPAAASTNGSSTMSPQVISAISGTWNGTTTPVGQGERGQISITFSSSAPGTVAASITWTSGDGKHQYTGNASGTLANLAASGLGPQMMCGYKASGAITGTTYAGTYETVGTGCGAANGTFSAMKQ
jgi:hypothetical protein